MGTEEQKIDDMYKEELAKCMGIVQVSDFPTAVKVEQDNLPDVQRWRSNE